MNLLSCRRVRLVLARRFTRLVFFAQAEMSTDTAYEQFWALVDEPALAPASLEADDAYTAFHAAAEV